MRVHFWGVRGSTPAPISTSQIKDKIASVVQEISKKDLINQETRDKFIDSLPKCVNGTVGGNTACVEVEVSANECIIFDAGSGIRELGIELQNRPGYLEKKNTYHIFFSHFHWDHIQGLPFFNPAFDEHNTIILYSTRKNFKKFLENQMIHPYFPIPMLEKGGFSATFEFRHIDSDEKYIHIGDAKVGWHRVRHPGGCVSYSVIEKGKKVIYSTDTELRSQDFEKNEKNKIFYTGADLFIIDAQYTMADSIEKQGWGHSTFSVAIDFASGWGIKKVALFHHEPTYNDRKLCTIGQSAEWYRNYIGAEDLEVMLAEEGMDIIL